MCSVIRSALATSLPRTVSSIRFNTVHSRSLPFTSQYAFDTGAQRQQVNLPETSLSLLQICKVFACGSIRVRAQREPRGLQEKEHTSSCLFGNCTQQDCSRSSTCIGLLQREGEDGSRTAHFAGWWDLLVVRRVNPAAYAVSRPVHACLPVSCTQS